MYRPRRTAELADNQPPASSTKKPPRMSRIAQPLRRPSTMRERSLDRASSADRLSSANNYLSVPSATKRQRSNSISITPQRTPTKRTPLVANKVQMTAEKQRAPINDKKWVSDQMAKITDYLKNVQLDALGKDFFSRGGIKSMSTKQFVAIVSHFLKAIVGNRVTIGANHVEDIAKILEQLDYPYNVAKSWLKTPSAPHALSNVVLLFTWLLSFSGPSLESFESFEQDFLIQSEECRVEAELNRKIAEMFIAWNNNDDKNDEFDRLQKEAIDALIGAKTNFADRVSLEAETERLKQDFEVLKLETIVIKPEDEEKYSMLKKEVSKKRNQVSKLKKSCDDYSKSLKEAVRCVQEEEKLISEVSQRIKQMMKMIAMQKITANERNNIIEEVNQLNHVLSAKKDSNCELEEMGHKNQLVLSRLKKQVTDLIEKVNNFITQIGTEYNSLDAVQDYYLNEKDDVKLTEQFERVELWLQEIDKTNSKMSAAYTKKISEMEKNCKMLAYKIENILKPKLATLMERLKATQEDVDAIDLKILQERSNAEREREEHKKDIMALEELNEMLKHDIAARKKEVLDARAENEAMLNELTKKFDVVHAFRDRMNKRMGDTLDHLQKSIDEYNAKWGDFKLQ